MAALLAATMFDVSSLSPLIGDARADQLVADAAKGQARDLPRGNAALYVEASQAAKARRGTQKQATVALSTPTTTKSVRVTPAILGIRLPKRALDRFGRRRASCSLQPISLRFAPQI